MTTLPSATLHSVTLCCVATVLCLSNVVRAGDAPRLDPSLPYQARRVNPVTYDVDFSVAVTAPYHTETLKVWLPIPQSDSAQEVVGGEINTFPMEVAPRYGVEPKYGNKFAYFEFSHPEGAQLIRHRFQIKVWELHWELDPKRIVTVREWPESFAPYLANESQAVVLNDGMDRLLSEIVPRRSRSYQDIASVMQWVDSHFTYDHVQASLQASSLHAFERQRGHCSDYHGFCAAMGRAIGYPTRVTYGINPFPKNSPSHCKLEIFLPPYGWVSFDVSETQKLAALIRKNEELTTAEKQKLIAAASQRLLGGFRDNTWFLQTRGTDYELEPPATRRVAVVRTIYAEADGKPLPEPDPSAKGQTEFSWMTIHKYEADRSVTYPFKDVRTLSASGGGVRATKPASSR